MFAEEFIKVISNYILFATSLFILAGSIYISIKTRFVQVRFLPTLFKTLIPALFSKKKDESEFTILPHRALFTAMSTTLGIGTIVGPIVAIHWGGPGALIGFLLTAFFGSAATYTEVNLCIRFRKKLESGEILGGPMEYLRALLSPTAAKCYAVVGSFLMASWSGAQANQLSAILDSPLLGDFRIPTMISGALTALLILFILVGGIKRISSFSAKLVPLMFFLYVGSCLWILGANFDRLPEIWVKIMDSLFSPYAMATGTLVGGVVSALRWGVFKGIQVTEAGVGTQTIPHSMAETQDPVKQGMLAMLSTYSAGIIAFLSGCVTLITDTWQDPSLPLGITMVAASFQAYFSYLGVVIVGISALLFVFGTILGNSFNGSQCFGYLTNNKGIYVYYAITALLVFIGAVSSIDFIWSTIDMGLAVLVIPHMSALVLYWYKTQRIEQEITAVTASG